MRVQTEKNPGHGVHKVVELVSAAPKVALCYFTRSHAECGNENILILLIKTKLAKIIRPLQLHLLLCQGEIGLLENRKLVDKQYLERYKIVLVMDNINMYAQILLLWKI